MWFGAATATELFTHGQADVRFGLAPALGAALALQRRRPNTATGLALLTALASPVAALFAGSPPSAYAVGTHRWRAGLGVVAAALVPVALLRSRSRGRHVPIRVLGAVAAARDVRCRIPGDPPAPNPESGDRVVRDRMRRRSRAAHADRGKRSAPRDAHRGTGGGAAAHRPASAGRRRRAPLYVQFQPPIRHLVTRPATRRRTPPTTSRCSTFLRHQPGPPFRIEIPPTRFHYEAYEVAPSFPLARGWERQLDIRYDDLFYTCPLTAATYSAWLHRFAVRFVAVADAPLDYAATREARLIRRAPTSTRSCTPATGAFTKSPTRRRS